ncbi:deuterosome assembly protein 1-like [Glandiceps talaboti]
MDNNNIAMMMTDFHRQAQEAGLFQGPLSSCEAELQELMRQIDIMVNNKKLDWDREMQTVQAKVDLRDKEAINLRADLESKHQEVGRLRYQLDSVERTQKDLVNQYEEQIMRLRNEMSNLKHDYERLQKHHNKQVLNVQRTREKVTAEFSGNSTELRRAQQKVDEYKAKLKDSESQKRLLQQQLIGTESQNKTLKEKCDLLQQQAGGYQDQLSKRRQLIDNTELNFRTQQSQLEGQLSRAQDTIQHKESMLQKLKTSVEETLASNKQLTEEHNRLIEDLQHAHRKNRKLEDNLGQVQLELHSRDDLLRIADQEQRQHSKELSHFEERLRIKDTMIRALEQGSQQERNIEIAQLNKELANAEGENRALRKNEQRILEEQSKLQTKLDAAQRECTDLNMNLTRKIDEIRRIETTEVKKLNSEITKTRDKYHSKEQFFSSEIDGMRSEISTLKTELHQRDITIASLSNEISVMERRIRENSDLEERLNNEIQVSNAQLDALRLENRHLRETTLNEKLANSKDLHDVESKLTELQDLQIDYNKTIAKLEDEARQLRHENVTLKQQLSNLKHQYNAALQETQSTITDIKSKDDRKMHLMQQDFQTELSGEAARHENTVERYKAEIKSLQNENIHLQEQLKQQVSSIKRLEGENGVMTEFISTVDKIAKTPPCRSPYSMSPSKYQSDSANTTQDRVELLSMPPTPQSHSSELSQRPISRNSVTTTFISEEKRRGRELEYLLDAHIEDLHKNTEATLKRFTSAR